MESLLSRNKPLIEHILKEMIEACDLIIIWNKDVKSAMEYPVTPQGIQLMAASCMLIETIGEGVKKIEKLAPQYLENEKPNIPWRNIMGLRNRIAHGYFNLDAEIIYDVAVNEIPKIKDNLIDLKSKLWN